MAKVLVRGNAAGKRRLLIPAGRFVGMLTQRNRENRPVGGEFEAFLKLSSGNLVLDTIGGSESMAAVYFCQPCPVFVVRVA